MSVEESDNGRTRAAEVIEQLREQGREVVEAGGCWWYNAYGQRRVLFAFPPHRLVSPTEVEVDGIFRQVPSAWALRHICAAAPEAASSCLWVRRRPYTIETLSANHRSKVRRGLKQCEVRPISFDELAASSHRAQSDTRRRHGRSEAAFGVSEAMRRSSAWQAWGAFVDGELAAFVVTLEVEGQVHIQVNRSTSALLKHYPNNALIFRVTEEALARPAIEAVCYGWESLTRQESLEQFKLGMGFEREPVGQRMVLAPRLRPLWNPVSRALLRGLLLLAPRNPRLQSIAGAARLIGTGR